MNEEPDDDSAEKETEGTIERILEGDEIRRIIATPRMIPREIREGIATILAQEIVLGQPYDIKDVRRFTERFGVFYLVFLGLKNSEEWRQLVKLAIKNENASVFALRSVLSRVLEIIDEFSKYAPELQKGLDENMKMILEELQELIKDTIRLWGRRVPKEIPKLLENPLDAADLFRDVIYLSEDIRKGRLQKEDVDDLLQILRKGRKALESFLATLRDVGEGLKDDESLDPGRAKKLQKTAARLVRKSEKLEEQIESLAEAREKDKKKATSQVMREIEELLLDMIEMLEKLAGEAGDLFQDQSYASVARLPERIDEFSRKKGSQDLLNMLVQSLLASHLANLVEEMKEHLELFDILSLLFPGRLWDYALSELHKTYLRNIKKYADVLRRSEDLKKILELIGRIELEFGTRRLAISPFGTSEVHSVTTSNDIFHLLPAELAKLSKESLRTLFYANWIEGKLLTYQFRGRSWVGGPPKKKRKGPVVALVDTSGSMSGSPEIVAKAVILAVVKRMLKEKRDVKVILFSSVDQTKEIDLTTVRKMASEFLEFLSYSFGGGTDFNTALESGLKSLKQKKFTSADLLFITDGLSVVSEKSLVKKWNALKKESDTRIFTMIVGNDNAGGLEDLSDHVFLLAEADDWEPDEGPARMIRLVSSPT